MLILIVLLLAFRGVSFGVPASIILPHLNYMASVSFSHFLSFLVSSAASSVFFAPVHVTSSSS